ncbi:MAG: recombination mediator RecR [Gammaproteobacteria bacterium]|jgi:recombination protein RecR|nr:recombination mediator RecR [Gammaproteobacteria bacterium]MDP6615609.1 recombination mediator RecR [Gammaproteobacteria bacterium]MDP6695856.1 recombination mediator RecR [Gammaproteobacteria bacterium]
MAYSPLLQQLLQALRCLPGVGPRTAQRMAFHLLERDREGARGLVTALSEGLERIGECEQCRMLAEETLCWVCASADRDASVLCVVESPADVIAVEDSGIYRGRYFVLQGRLSPLDGIGPEELGLNLFERQIAAGDICEIILATSSTVEGEATAGYLAGLAQEKGINVSRIAHGVPIGGELEYVDRSTLSRAISGRQSMDLGS